MAETPSDSEYAARTENQTSIPMSSGLASASEPQPVPDLIDYVTDYAKKKPEVAAMWCFGIGFVLGWKLKPW